MNHHSVISPSLTFRPMHRKFRVPTLVRAHRCVRTASGSDPITAQLVWMIPALPLRVLTRRAPVFLLTTVARYNQERSNNSLDASRGSASHNLFGGAPGALIRAAASTQPLGPSSTRKSPTEVGTPKRLRTRTTDPCPISAIGIAFAAKIITGKTKCNHTY
jgi:hypothetical protein